jgi:phytoene synthase
MAKRLSELGAHVRVHDPDRFYAALFAPSDRREALFALLAFHHEIARVREIVSEPHLGEIRPAWWREALAEIEAGGPARAHPVAQALAAARAAHNFSLTHLFALIDARAFDLADEPMRDLGALEAYARATGGGLHRAMAEVLGANEEGAFAAECAGTAWALTGILRALPIHFARRQCYLPADRLVLHHVALAQSHGQTPSAGLAAVIAEVATLADQHRARAALMRAGEGRPAVLPIALIPAYLHRITRASHSPLPAPTAIGLPERLLRLLVASLTAR